MTHVSRNVMRRHFLGAACIVPMLASPNCFLAQTQEEGLRQMPDAEFWRLIDLLGGSKWNDDTTEYSALIANLGVLSPSEIGGFYETLSKKAYALDTKEHYSKFSNMAGLADSFLYTRLAVIGNGRAVYGSVLENPEAFPERSPDIWLEDLMYSADKAYFLKTGKSFDRVASVSIESFSNEKGWKP